MKKVDEYIGEEKALMDLEYDFVCDFIKLRKDNNLTQQKLSDLSGVIRETIARIEAGITSPQISTLIKILKPLGYAVKIEKIEK